VALLRFTTALALDWDWWGILDTKWNKPVTSMSICYVAEVLNWDDRLTKIMATPTWSLKAKSSAIDKPEWVNCGVAELSERTTFVHNLVDYTCNGLQGI
jgi:hypothetical protein